MSQPTSSHAYGIGLITVLVGTAVGLGYYQMFYLPESLAKPSVDIHILEPEEILVIEIVMGSALESQEENYVPKEPTIDLKINNHVVWENVDEVAHTVTPDHRMEDSYSGEFGSPGVILPGDSYEFIFTEPHIVEYHCQPHPWMKGTLTIQESRF